MIFVDSNVLIDIFNTDQQWSGWSRTVLSRLADEGEGLAINPIVVAEIASNFASLEALLAIVGGLDIEVLPLDESVAFSAGRAFRLYRRSHKDRSAILAGFLIGSHADVAGGRLLTRDVDLYRRYFPDLTLITPETHP